MTKTEPIKSLEVYPDYACVVLSDNKGWSNIDAVKPLGSRIALVVEKYPLFSDN